MYNTMPAAAAAVAATDVCGILGLELTGNANTMCYCFREMKRMHGFQLIRRRTRSNVYHASAYPIPTRNLGPNAQETLGSRRPRPKQIQIQIQIVYFRQHGPYKM